MKTANLSIALVGLTLTVAALGATRPKKGEISMKQAREKATKEVSGKIKSEEFEFEKGQDVYSFDIDGQDGKIHEVLVSAKSGKIVSSTIESPEQEEKEAKQEK